MTQEEIKKQKEIQDACKDGLKSTGTAVGNQLKEEIHNYGIVGTLVKGAFEVGIRILLGK